MTSAPDDNLPEAASIANRLGVKVTILQDRKSWPFDFELACQTMHPDEVRSRIVGRVANIVCLVIRDTQHEDLDLMLNGVAMGIEDGLFSWGDFAMAMGRQGQQDSLAEMEARVLQLSASSNSCPPPRKRL